MAEQPAKAKRPIVLVVQISVNEQPSFLTGAGRELIHDQVMRVVPAAELSRLRIAQLGDDIDAAADKAVELATAE